MTTYILHGGKTSSDSAYNNLLFKQFTALVEKNHVNILLCYWAREKKTWNELFEKDKAKIFKRATKKADVDIVDTSENLVTQLKKADVLFVSGGEEEFLRPYISKIQYLKEALKNKIYIGSSMGAFLASKHYILSLDGQDTNAVHDGLDLVPYNILCHWNIETKKDQKKKMLKECDPQTQILLLEEEKFITLRI